MVVSYTNMGYGQPDHRFERSGPAEAGASAHSSRPTPVDLTAPVIHFGVSREVAPRQYARAQDDKGIAFLTAPTKEQKMHTLFIGSISDKLDDFWMERVLKSIPKLRQWKRALDGTGHNCSYGFAEYEDPESLDRAYNILKDIQVPSGPDRKETSHFLVTQDPMSKLFIDDSLALRDNKIPETKERNIVSTSLGQIEKVWKDFSNPKYKRHEETTGNKAKASVIETPTAESQAVTIMLNIEDELGDIAEELRASIAGEITSFRERSAKREQERARQIADVEARRLEIERNARLEARNKTRDVQGEEVALIRYTKTRPRIYEEDDLTDDEIGKMRKETFLRDSELKYIEELSRWEFREAARIKAFQRDSASEEESRQRLEAEKEYLAEQYAKFDDDKETSRASMDYYKDRSSWLQARATFRAREIEADRQNILEEMKEVEVASKMAEKMAPKQTQSEKAIDSAIETATVRLQLAKKTTELRTTTGPDIILADEDEPTVSKRVLPPLQYDDEAGASSAPRARPQRNLKDIVHQIPTIREDLYEHAVMWNQLNDVILAKLQAFVAKKVVEVVGMEDADLTSLIIDNIERRCRPQEIEEELNAIIGDDEESKLTTTRIWRYLLILLETAEVVN